MIEDLQPSAESKPTIKLWTPNTIGALTFFTGFPTGITLASINWIRMGMKWKAFAHILGGLIGILALLFLPGNLIRPIALLVNFGFLAYLRYQMEADIGKTTDINIQNAHWFSGCLTSLLGWGIVIAVGTVIIFLQPLIPNTSEYYYTNGNSYREKGDYKNAIASYTKAIDIDPTYSFAYTNRGGVYDELGELDLAIADYNKAIELNPKDYLAHNNRGYSFYTIGNYDHAIDDYTKAIQIDPENFLAHINRGNAYYDIGNYELAMVDYTFVIKINPENAYAYYQRGLAYAALGQTNEAVKDFEKVLEITTDPSLRQETVDELQKLNR